LAYTGWKFFKGTEILSLDDIPIQDALDEMREKPEEPIPPTMGWQRLNILWG
jgi:amino acid transporter